ncbi:MAG: WG repeat-containing protein [Eubacteriales bacterium]|nr:WG repeat-containing protein [Eubacteriales bacterium]
MRKILSAILAASMLMAAAPSALAASFEIEPLVTPTYERVGNFSDGRAAVKQNGKWGYIDETGKMVVKPKYDWAGPYSEGVTVVAQLQSETYQEGTEYEYTMERYELYLLDENDAEVRLYADQYDENDAPLDYSVDEFTAPIEQAGFSWFCQDGVVFVDGHPFTKAGKEIKAKITDEYVQTCTMTGPCVGGVIPMYADSIKEGAGQAFFMDASGNITRRFPIYRESNITCVYAPEQDRIVAQKGAYDDEWNWVGGWGAMDLNGNWVVQPVYDGFRYLMSGRFFCDGLWTVYNTQGRYGAVDKNGKVVIPLQYEFMSSFTEGMCAAKKNGKMCYLDLSGKTYQPGALGGGEAKADAASQFNGGVAPVYVGADGQAYCVQNVPKNGVLPAISGTQNLAREVYFPDYVEGSNEYGTLSAVGNIIAIKENGKWGFSKLTFHLDLPDESAMDKWAYDEVCKAIEAGLVPNTLQNQYRSNITRADFALLLTEVASAITEKDIETLVKSTTGKELDELVAAHPFTDTRSEAVVAANALGILNGYGNGKFGPYDTISRQDAATMLLRAATAIKADALEGWGDKIAAANVQFADGAAFSGYAKQAIEVMAALDVMKGTGNNRFAPKETYTRQQSFMTVYRLMTQILDEAA